MLIIRCVSCTIQKPWNRTFLKVTGLRDDSPSRSVISAETALRTRERMESKPNTTDFKFARTEYRLTRGPEKGNGSHPIFCDSKNCLKKAAGGSKWICDIKDDLYSFPQTIRGDKLYDEDNHGWGCHYHIGCPQDNKPHECV